jgi:hypothetical protein
MSFARFLYPVLDALNDGRMIRRGVSMVLTVGGAVTLIAGAIGAITILKVAIDSNSSTEMTIGGLLYAVILAAVALAVFQVFRYRAEHISRLEDSPFTVMPIVSLLMRCVGEVYATVLVGLGVGAFLLMLLAGNAASFIMSQIGVLPGIPAPPGGAGLLGAVTSLTLFAAFAFISLVFFYFVAEAALVAADVARNIRLLVDETQRRSPSPAAAMANSPLEAVVPTRAEPSMRDACPKCATRILEAGTVFCENCGTRLVPA